MRRSQRAPARRTASLGVIAITQLGVIPVTSLGMIAITQLGVIAVTPLPAGRRRAGR